MSSLHQKQAELNSLRSQSETTRVLKQASNDRELVRALMAEDWLGLEVLDALQDPPIGLTISSLARKTDRDVDLLATTLAALVQFGALNRTGTLFCCSRSGQMILEKLHALTESDAR